MILNKIIQKCNKYQTNGCASCPWNNDLENCLDNIIEEYNDSVSNEERLKIYPKKLMDELQGVAFNLKCNRK